MLADEHPEQGAVAPTEDCGPPVSFMLYVHNVDDQFKQAIVAGGIEVRPVQDQFYGDRSGTLEDPFGHQWTISTHVEDVAPEEVEKRLQGMDQAAGG